MSNAPWIVATFAVVMGPALTYLIATRNASGKIQTSEAADLWAESRDIRAFLSVQLRERDEAIKRLEDENRELHKEIKDLRLALEAHK